MTDQLDDLLRRALTEAPTPPTSVPDPVAAVDRRVRRAHVLLASVATAVVAAVAVVVPVAVSSSGTTRPLPVLHSGSPKPQGVWSADGGLAVATGDGYVWSLVDVRGTQWVRQHDPATGTVVHSWSVPGPVQHLAVGLGRVWAYGGTEGPGAAGMVAALDPATGAVASRSYPGLVGPFDMAFLDGSAWVTLVQADRVEELSVAGAGTRLVVESSSTVPGRPSFIAPGNDGTLWINEGARHRIVPLTVGRGPGAGAKRPRLGPEVDWAGHLLAPGTRGVVWSEQSPLLVALSPGDLGVCTSCSTSWRLLVHGFTMAVAVGRNGAVFAAVEGFDGGYLPPGRVGLLAYAPGADLGSRPIATFVPKAGSDIRAIAADPAGGVVYATDAGVIGRWVPAAPRR
jgi:hypothetical protein